MATSTHMLTPETVIQIWPILTSLTIIISLLAVALYRLYIVEKEKKEERIRIEERFKEIKGNLFRADGELIYATAVETELLFNKMDIRLDVAETHCKRIDNVERDVNRLQDQQQKNMDKNLTINVHDLGCKIAQTELKDWVRDELNQIRKDLFEGNIGARRKND